MCGRMYQIRFREEQKTTMANDGENLLEVMRRADLHPDAPCGGHGKCGKCRVKLVSEQRKATETVLACQTYVGSDLIVETIHENTEHRILTEGMHAKGTYAPLIRQACITVRPCARGESTSDWSRLLEGLKEAGLLDEETVLMPEPAIASGIGPLQKETDGKLWVLLSGNEILRISKEKHPYYMAGFDIGTTTVVGYLLDGENGNVLTAASRLNPQAEFGGDVINRANYALEHGTKKVTECIREAVDTMCREMADQSGIDPQEITAVSIVGNTCMHHLFLGISVDSLVHAPYNPVVSEPMIVSAARYGIHIHPQASLYILPNIAGFVGADTVACLVSTDLAEVKDWTLLIDIGTNGEMVLAKDRKMICCSTAAGPAFEGAGITHGMRGSSGAISKVKWRQDHWEYETVGNAAPRGLCGSGLLDLISELLLSGQIDEMGQLQTEETYVVLADEKHSADGTPVTLEQKDISQLQLAKAAIAAGVHLLAESRGIAITDIKEVWLAGAFGSFLSPESACNIGLIPPELRGRIRAVGNAAGEGAKRVLLERKTWKHAKELAESCDFLELAALPEFQDRYVDELEFPELSWCTG